MVDAAIVEHAGGIALVDSMVGEIHGVGEHDLGHVSRFTRPP